MVVHLLLLLMILLVVDVVEVQERSLVCISANFFLQNLCSLNFFCQTFSIWLD